MVVALPVIANDLKWPQTTSSCFHGPSALAELLSVHHIHAAVKVKWDGFTKMFLEFIRMDYVAVIKSL